MYYSKSIVNNLDLKKKMKGPSKLFVCCISPPQYVLNSTTMIINIIKYN